MTTSLTLWVDTDYGFDDLWALLVLARHGRTPAGISLVAGNAPLPRVIANARGGAAAYDLQAPLYAGAAQPLVRPLETATRVLGPKGMSSRGPMLPEIPGAALPDAIPALADWLLSAAPNAPREVLALGPLTNIARLLTEAPQAAQKITRLVWMGGSNGPGNHSPRAEFNALADPEAAAQLAAAGLPLEVADLMLCRQVTFGPDDMPEMDVLTAGLLQGYLDIGLSRGRAGMAIYDPVAAMVYLRPDLFQSLPCDLSVSTTEDDSYGETMFAPNPHGTTRLVTAATDDIAQVCLGCLSGWTTP